MVQRSRVDGFQLARAGELRMEPGTLAARAKAFAAALPPRGAATLLVTRTGSGITSSVLLPASGSSLVAVEHLAAATASTPHRFEVDSLDLSAAAVGRVVFRADASTVRDTQVGADLAALAQVLGRAMRPGSWVAASLRAPSSGEMRSWNPWLQRRLKASTPHHHSNESNALVMAVTGGARSKDEVVSLLSQVMAAMPGFDIPVKVKVPARWPFVLGGVAAGLAASAALFVTAGPLESVTWLVALTFAGIAVSSTVRAGLTHPQALQAVVARPPLRWVPPRRPSTQKRDDGTVVEHDGTYPLASRAFMVGAHLPAALVAPHTGGLTGAGATTDRDVPPLVATRIGPLIGVGRSEVPVHLSAADAFAGALVVGRAGSGKSVCIRQLFAWHLLEKFDPSGLPGAPGRDCAVVAIESKTDGAAHYIDWARRYGEAALLVDVMDADTYAVDLIPKSGPLDVRARQLVAQMQYAFGEDAISNKSFDTLVDVAMGALVVDTEIANLAGLDPGRGVMYYMAVLVEAEGQERQEALAGAIMSTAVNLESRGAAPPDLVVAGQRLRGLFDGKTPAQRRTWTDAPSSKIKPLLSLDSWWSTSRNRVSWDVVFRHHGVLVINFGPSMRTGAKADQVLTQQLQSMLMYSLRQAIEEHCTGWGSAGQSVAIFSDELSLLAGKSPEVVTWLRDQGRSYGVRPFFALQYPEQLSPQVRTSVLGFSTLIALTQDNREVASALADDFAADGTQWAAQDIVNLPPHAAVARLNVGQQRQPAFTVKLTSWEDRKDDFAAAQGYRNFRDA